MHNKCFIKLEDEVTFLEKEHNFLIDRRGPRRRVDWAYRNLHPRKRDCRHLVQTLFDIRNEDPGCLSYVQADQDSVLRSDSWTYAEWIRDYERYGIIPGICIDCKCSGTQYSMILVIINGGTNSGRVCTYFMGFLSTETLESFIWSFQCFKRILRVAPSMIAMDQQAGRIRAARTIFPASYVTLDDWHANKNQLANVGNYTTSIRQTHLAREMNNDLHVMRRSSKASKCLRRRDTFEAKSFAAFATVETTTPPDWFKTLYRMHAAIMIDCHNKTACDPRFLFQGSGYTESSNAIYRKLIVCRKVLIQEVPREMRRVTQIRIRLRRAEET